MAPAAGVADTDSRFFASATAPVVGGFEMVRVVAVGAEDPIVEGREVAVREGTAPAAVVGFLTVPVVVPATVLGLAGDAGVPVTAEEVRREAADMPDSGARFFSSSETEGRDRCETDEAAVEGLFGAVVAVPGRTGGLAAVAEMPVRVLVVELAVDLVPVVLAPTGRRVVEDTGPVVRFVAVVPAVAFLSTVLFGEVGVEGATDSEVVTEAGAGTGAGASLCWTTSKLSASDMMGYGSK